MQLFVSCQDKHLVAYDESTSVEGVKAFIAAREGIPADVTYVTAGGRVLESGTLASHGVQPLSTVSVGVRMVGGKVHGSLARAGKVKGQTPKVEPQEKKKKKTGRAKRRIQYNKRFVNVVVGPGKKRGPNSNSE
eukprot:m.160582 g.160582  ORF g.160582 m.160582 type:complete len:134 (-) comp11963_c0_seq1:31-432(-)